MILHALQESRLGALASFLPTEVLLLTGYWPVGFTGQPTDILEAGMTFNSEPAIYLDGAGDMRGCETVACTQGGAEVLTDF